jgi:adenylate cyclase
MLADFKRRSVLARALSGAAIGLFAGIAVLGVERTGALERIERATLDWRQRRCARGEAASPIGLVYLGELSRAAAEKDGIYFPWPRGIWAAILTFLARDAGARAVAFDIIFSEPSPYKDDDYDLELERAIARSKIALFVLTFSANGTVLPPAVLDCVRALAPEVEIEDPKLAALFPEMRGILSPTLARFLAVAKGVGNAQHPPDPDGIYRRIHPFVRFEGRLYPSISLAVAREALGGGPIRLTRERVLEVGPPERRRRVPLEPDGTMLIRFGPEVRAAHASAIEAYAAMNAESDRVARRNIGEDVFREKAVFIAYSAPGLYDVKPNPIMGTAPAVLVHAAAAENVIDGRPLRSWTRSGPLPLVAALSGIGALVAGLVAAAPRVIWQIAATLALGGAWFAAASFYFFPRDLVVDLVAPEAAVALAFAAGTLYNYVTEGRQRRAIKDAFQHYLSPAFVEELLRDPTKLRLGGERRELTIFFSDLAGFTTMSEKLEPEELVRLLNHYLTRMTSIILKHGGTHDKYEGDAIMCFFGAPVDLPAHAVMACLAAIEQQAEIARINQEWGALGLPSVHARMGINTGVVVVGNMGSEMTMDYTVMGDPVNLASRLEGANKPFGTLMMVGERTQELAKDSIDFRELAGLRVKGKRKPVRVYEILGKRGETPKARLETARLFETALRAYEKRDFARAAAMFEALKEEGDKPSELYVEECRRFLKEPPPPDWDGVITLTSK